MAEKIMLFAIPGFFILMALEVLAAWLMKRRVYRLNDAINSIGLGVLSQIVGVFAKLLTIGIYAWVVQRVALFELPLDKAWVWISALVLYDFCYYWLHRMGHEVNVLWAAHVVHHQSERYNLSTALRQTGSGVLLGWMFYLPMAVLGYPVEVFAVVAVIDLLYQYWIHTELIGKLGWFDRVFASPSNHRAHHAVNDRYLDRNYGGIFILWDRLFGTFVEEDEVDKPVYGTRAPLRSWNPLWANAEVYWAMARGMPGMHGAGATSCAYGSRGRAGVRLMWRHDSRSRNSTCCVPITIRRCHARCRSIACCSSCWCWAWACISCRWRPRWRWCR